MNNIHSWGVGATKIYFDLENFPLSTIGVLNFIEKYNPLQVMIIDIDKQNYVLKVVLNLITYLKRTKNQNKLEKNQKKLKLIQNKWFCVCCFVVYIDNSFLIFSQFKSIHNFL